MNGFRMRRLPAVKDKIGHGRSTIYARINKGLLPPPVALSANASAWPEHELDAINAAVLRGATDDELRALVVELVTLRAAAA